MKKLIVVLNFLLLITIGGQAQESDKGLYSVAFYNLENLFDTIHDAGKNVFEYLPDGPKQTCIHLDFNDNPSSTVLPCTENPHMCLYEYKYGINAYSYPHIAFVSISAKVVPYTLLSKL